jgi:hypothetical protein
MKAILTSLLLIFKFSVFGQTFPVFEDSTHIFWQPNTTIKFTDYKLQTPPQALIDNMEKYKFSAAASVGLWSILDTPKKVKDRNIKFEKVYIVPAFDKFGSCAKENDSIQIKIQNTYLDIAELSARWARKELRTIQDSTKATGTLTIIYESIRVKMQNKRKEFGGAFTKEVLIDKQEGAYMKWRNLIEELLEKTKEWATSPVECYRFVAKKPIEKGYIVAPIVFPDMSK